jgi:hypothetical protein
VADTVARLKQTQKDFRDIKHAFALMIGLIDQHTAAIQDLYVRLGVVAPPPSESVPDTSEPGA